MSDKQLKIRIDKLMKEGYSRKDAVKKAFKEVNRSLKHNKHLDMG